MIPVPVIFKVAGGHDLQGLLAAAAPAAVVPAAAPVPAAPAAAPTALPAAPDPPTAVLLGGRSRFSSGRLVLRPFLSLGGLVHLV